MPPKWNATEMTFLLERGLQSCAPEAESLDTHTQMWHEMNNLPPMFSVWKILFMTCPREWIPGLGSTCNSLLTQCQAGSRSKRTEWALDSNLESQIYIIRESERTTVQLGLCSFVNRRHQKSNVITFPFSCLITGLNGIFSLLLCTVFGGEKAAHFDSQDGHVRATATTGKTEHALFFPALELFHSTADFS